MFLTRRRKLHQREAHTALAAPLCLLTPAASRLTQRPSHMELECDEGGHLHRRQPTWEDLVRMSRVKDTASRCSYAQSPPRYLLAATQRPPLVPPSTAVPLCGRFGGTSTLCAAPPLSPAAFAKRLCFFAVALRAAVITAQPGAWQAAPPSNQAPAPPATGPLGTAAVTALRARARRGSKRKAAFAHLGARAQRAGRSE